MTPHRKENSRLCFHSPEAYRFLVSAIELMHSVKALPEGERSAFYDMLIADEELREDLLDSIIIAERRNEPSMPLDVVLRELKIKL